KIADRSTDPGRWIHGPAVGAGEAAVGLYQGLIAGQHGHRSHMTESGNRAINQARMTRTDGLGVDAKFLGNTWPEIVHQDVRFACKRLQRGLTACSGQIKAHRFLATVKNVEAE